MKLIEKILFVVLAPVTVPIALIGAVVVIWTMYSFCKKIEGDSHGV